MDSKYIVIILVIVLNLSSTGADNKDKEILQLKLDFSAQVHTKDSLNELRIRLDKALPTITLQEIFDFLRYGGDPDFLELIWWRSERADQRKLIVALLRSQAEDEVDVVPDFMKFVGRFAVPEAKEREREVNEGKLLSKVIHEKLKKP